MPNNNTYLDSSILVGAIIDKEEARSEAIHALKRIANSGQTIIIPQLVIGETFFQIYDNSDPKQLEFNIHKFTEWLQCLIPYTKGHVPAFDDKILNSALEIRDNDSNLDYYDCIIVSHALLDKESLYLYTTDKGIHNSKIIAKKIKECKEENGHELKIKPIGD
jgi:predicted nucleic acid-binding protein